MTKIPKEHLEFLEFVMKKINEGSPGWWPLDGIAKEYNKKSIIKISLDEVRDIAALYKNNLFKTSSNSDLKIFPIPEIKQGIKKHVSLLKYLHALNHKKTKATNKQNWIIISPIVVAVLMLLVTVYFGISNDNKTKEIRILKQEIINKDSIILELNNKININDTLKIKNE
jgi:hypothetical protein